MATEPHTHVQRMQLSRIARLNDTFRRTGEGGTLIATAGVIHLAQDALPSILRQVAAFDTFSPNNDPYGEHDFCAFTWQGERLFWKIDYYDRDMRYASPDAADPAVTLRVLTIMLATEY